VWHASVSGPGLPDRITRRLASKALRGVGDPRHEWHETGHVAYHVRRRLTEREAAHVSPVADLRGTLEARARWAALHAELPPAVWRVALEELGEKGGST